MRSGGIVVVCWMLLLGGCAKAPVKPNTSLCLMAESNVRQRLGPEFRRVLKTKLLHSDRVGSYGCAIAYEMMDEELSDEFESQPSEVQTDSHIVAFLSRSTGAPARFLEIKRTRTATGPVTVNLEAVEVTGDSFLDLVILERAKRPNSLVDYRGLKIINGDPELTSEILEIPLIEKTPDNTEILFEWVVDASGTTPKLWLRGGNQAISYTYSARTRRMMRGQPAQNETIEPAKEAQVGSAVAPAGGEKPTVSEQPSTKDKESPESAGAFKASDLEPDPPK
jgi:hypothetical protein